MKFQRLLMRPRVDDVHLIDIEKPKMGNGGDVFTQKIVEFLIIFRFIRTVPKRLAGVVPLEISSHIGQRIIENAEFFASIKQGWNACREKIHGMLSFSAVTYESLLPILNKCLEFALCPTEELSKEIFGLLLPKEDVPGCPFKNPATLNETSSLHTFFTTLEAWIRISEKQDLKETSKTNNWKTHEVFRTLWCIAFNTSLPLEEDFDTPINLFDLFSFPVLQTLRNVNRKAHFLELFTKIDLLVKAH